MLRKKHIPFLYFFALASSTLIAQNFEKGGAHLHFGISVPNKIFVKEHKLRVMPISITFEKAIMNKLTVGGTLGYAASRSKIYRFHGDPYFHQHRFVIGMVRSAYHINIFNPEQFDVYAGLGAGIKIGWAGFKGYGNLADFETRPAPANSGFIYSIFAGAHYFYNNYLRFFGELGIGSMPVSVGVQVQL
jgi:hypothetical protein